MTVTAHSRFTSMTGPCWVCGGTTLTTGSTRPSSSSRRGASRIPSSPPTPARRSGCAAARACGFAQPERMPALPRYLRADVRPALVARVGRAGVRFDVQGSDLPRAFSTTLGDARAGRRRARCSTSAATPAASCSSRARPAGAPKEPRSTSAPPRTPPRARASRSIACSAERLPELGRQLRRRHAHRRARAHSRTGGAAVDRAPRRHRRRVGRDQGAVRACAAAERDLARAPQHRLSGHARRQPRPRQPLFAAVALRRALERAGFDDVTVEIARAGVPARRARRHRSSASRCTTSAGACPAAFTRRSRCTCRRLRAPGPIRRRDEAASA